LSSFAGREFGRALDNVTNPVNTVYRDALRGKAKPVVLVVLYTRI
jgi:hypothetical protein